MTPDEARAAQLRAGNLLLPHDESDRSKTYLMPDPEHEGSPYETLYAQAWSGFNAPDKVTVNRVDLHRVLALARGYLTLTTYELGQEHCVGKLRDIWRARRARR